MLLRWRFTRHAGSALAAQKLATCCYCGTRAALVLRGDVRHELSCVSCGAPLHDLKLMPVSAPAARPVETTVKKPAGSPAQKAKRSKSDKASKPKKGKRRKFGVKLGRKLSVSRLVSKVWDEIEDVVDDIFD